MRGLKMREKTARIATELLEVLTRNGAATKKALWSQTPDDVFIYAFAPHGTRGRDVHVALKEKWLRITVHETEKVPTSAMNPPTPACKRPIQSVVLCGKLAFRVRVGDEEDADWEVTDVFDSTLAPRRAVRVNLRKRAPGSNFVPSSTPEWDPYYDGPGLWRESIVKVWWNKLMKLDAVLDLSTLPDRDNSKAQKTDQAWRVANEEFRRDVLNIKPVDLSVLCVESAKEKERDIVEKDLIRSGVPKGCAEWEEAMLAADERAKLFGAKEIAEARVWRDQALARDAQTLEKENMQEKDIYNNHLDSQWTTPVNSQGDEVMYGGPYWRPTL
mmetsp:Transcript_53752/g.87032  ORF Transcript_53752/g.87032 Transcript_53752/m.87032 type:complete len:329 (-) Transcript_53752:53-1039(-)